MNDVRTCEGCGCPVEEPALTIINNSGQEIVVCLGCQEQVRAAIAQMKEVASAVLLPILGVAADAMKQLAKALREAAERQDKNG